MNIYFVILHYNEIVDTQNCIESIQKNLIIDKQDNINIIVIDNCSPNKTGEQLFEMYSNVDDNNIKVILNKKNMGFSAGNNVGYRYAKENGADFIVMINNDTLIMQPDFIKNFKDEYEKHKYAVLGPKIVDKSGNVFVVRNVEPTIKYIKKRIFGYKREKILVALGLDYLFNKVRNIIKYSINKTEKDNNIAYNYNFNILLSGCCWIFSKEYINRFDGLDEKTFMYCEEEFLYYKLKNNNLLSIYSPKIEIIHLECGATNKIEKTKRKSLIRKYNNLIIAEKELLKVMQERNANSR